jgi:hypothetical protein
MEMGMPVIPWIRPEQEETFADRLVYWRSTSRRTISGLMVKALLN